MTRRISLENFDGGKGRPEPDGNAPPDIDLDAIRAASYEDGYKSGWDDCHAEHVTSEKLVSSDLAQSIKALDQAYHNARRDVISAVRPVIDAMVEQLLPKLAAEGLSARVLDELAPMLSDAADLTPELIAAPAMVPALQRLVDHSDEVSVRVRPDSGLTGAQVSLRLGAESRDIDMTRAVAEMGRELDRFTDRLIADLTAAPK